MNKQTPRPPGRLVDIEAHRLHLHCAGDGAPTVFDATLAACSLSWSRVQPSIARVTRACAYDRAGFGWSEGGLMPRTAGRIADELHQLLEIAAVPGPYILVGHSYGGLVMRVFAARHAAAVAGLVLIEPAIPEEWVTPSPEQHALIRRGVRLCRCGAGAARFGVKMKGFSRRCGSCRPKRVSQSAAEMLRETHENLVDMPLIVMSSSAARERRIAADLALAKQSRRGRHIVVPESGHWVPLDAPQAVIDAIVDIVPTR